MRIDWNTLDVKVGDDSPPSARWTVQTDHGVKRGTVEQIVPGIALAYPTRNADALQPGVGDTVREAIDDLLAKSGEWV